VDYEVKEETVEIKREAEEEGHRGGKKRERNRHEEERK